MTLDDMKNEIISCLDYDLRHSSHFSGVSGNCDCARFSFTSDYGSECNIKISIELEDIELSEPYASIKPEDFHQPDIDLFIKMLYQYIDKHPRVLPADDPEKLLFGFVYDADDLEDENTYIASCPMSILKNKYPDEFKKLIEVKQKEI